MILHLPKFVQHSFFSTATLAHSGKKGMKWGVRHDRSAPKAQTAQQMSLDELKKATKRMQLEQQYTTLLNKQNETVVTKGAYAVANMLGQAGREVAKNHAVAQMNKALAAAPHILEDATGGATAANAWRSYF